MRALQDIFRINEDVEKIGHVLYKTIEVAIRKDFVATGADNYTHGIHSNDYDFLYKTYGHSATYKSGRQFQIYSIEQNIITIKEFDSFSSQKKNELNEKLITIDQKDLDIDHELYKSFIDMKSLVMDEIQPHYEQIIKEFKLSDYPGYKFYKAVAPTIAKGHTTINCNSVVFVEHPLKKGFEYETWIYLTPINKNSGKPNLEILV